MTTGEPEPHRLPGPKGFRENLRLTRAMFQDPVPVLDECARRYGATFGLGAGPVRMVVVGEPRHLSALSAQPNSSFRWGHWANVLGFIVGPTSLIVSDGDEHHRRRAAVQPAFARRRLDGWVPMIVSETDRMIDVHLHPALAGGGSVDVYPLGKDLVLAITVKAFFGNGLEDRTTEIGEIFEELQAYLELPALRQIPHRLPFTRRARVRATRLSFDRIVDQEIARRRSAAAGSPHGAPGETGDLLDVFVDGSARLSGEEIHDQVNSLIGAGYNTTAATLAWTVQRALATPGVWAQLRSEADLVFGPVDQRPKGSGTIQDLTYAAAVVHESLRLHPAGAIAPRQAITDVPIGDHLIRKGSLILWSPYLSGRDPDTWDQPLEFRPERHLDPAPDTVAAMDAAWVPFGKGPRRCIGFALAQMELTLILARLAQRLDVNLVRSEIPPPQGMVVNRPRGGVPVYAAR